MLRPQQERARRCASPQSDPQFARDRMNISLIFAPLMLHLPTANAHDHYQQR